MKYLLKISSALLVISLLFAFAKPEKKIYKLVSKIWKNEEVAIKKVDIPDTLKTDVSQLNAIYVDGVHVGYGCYTTAFGCRVGGCAAPKNANVQSYETFDYIVIYDTDMSIIRVDIANYGGQYGYEICRAKWLEQFEGNTTGFKLNENIDGISGATVSASFLIDDLNDLGKLMVDLKSEKLI